MADMWRHAEKTVKAKIDADPRLREWALETWPKVEAAGIRDVVFQRTTRASTIVDKFICARLLAALENGSIVMAGIDVGEGPHSDIAIAENNAALSGLPDGITAEFQPRCNAGWLDCDGSVTWSRAISGIHSSGDRLIRPSSAALEVGYTSSAKMLVVLEGRQAMARWPYNDHLITVIVPTAMA